VFARVRDLVHTYVASLSLAAGRRASALAFFPVSALAGDNVVRPSARTPWYDGPTLLSHLEALPSRPADDAAPARFAVQWVRRAGARGYAGRLGSGTLSVGDRVRVLPAGNETRVVAIDTLSGATETVGAGVSATLTLSDEVDVARGDVLVRAAEESSISDEVTVDLAWVAREPLRAGAPYLLKHGTRKVRAVVTAVEAIYEVESGAEKSGDSLALNELGRVRLRTSEPLVWDAYDSARESGRAILIAPVTAETLAVAVRT
jgi:sulfate adenylyltransferase subunit 1